MSVLDFKEASMKSEAQMNTKIPELFSGISGTYCLRCRESLDA